MTDLKNYIARQMFTEDEWDAIHSAMGDYQDYGDEEAELANQVRHKISDLFS